MTHSDSDTLKMPELPDELFGNDSPSTAGLDALPDPVFFCTPEGDLVYWNRRAREVIGYAAEEVVPTNVEDIVPSELHADVRDALARAVHTGTARLEVPVRIGSGEQVPFEVTGSAAEWDGKTFVCAVARNVSRRKAREEELRRREEQFQLLVEGVEEYAIFMLGPEGHVTTWNAGAARIKGYTEEEILGKHFSEFYPEEDVEAGLPDEVLKTAERDGQWIDEGWRVRKDGSRFWARVTVTALRGEEGQLRGFAKVTRDMTERRQREKALRESEQRYRRLFEESRDAIILSTPDGEIVDVNGAAEELFGYSREEFLELDASDLYAHPEERGGRVMPNLRRATSSHQLEARMRHKDGHTFLISSSATVHRDEHGEPELIQSLVRDITDRRELERDVLRAQEEERRRIGRDLHDGVSSRLTGVSLMLGAALEALDEEHPASERIRDAKELVKETGRDVRQLSRGLTPARLEEKSLSEALAQLSSSTESCRFVEEGDVPELTEDQKKHIYWIAQEAVTNAQVHADATEIIIRLTGDGGFTLIVEDDGAGFDRSALQEEEGLGLRTMRYRVELLGGEFSVDSAPGEGTRIQCRLPSFGR